jgi:hypothetical protein
MADSEKHPIRNRIIFPVVSGLILAGLIYFIPKFFSFLQGALSTTWNYLLSGTLVPNSLLFLLIILAIPTILRLIKFFFRSKLQRTSDENNLSLYKSDFLFGMSWKWSFINSNDLPSQDLWCFCPSCATRLVCQLGINGNKMTTKFLCENCGFCSNQFVGSNTDALNTVIREIERRINTGEWKDKIKKLDSKKVN